MLQNKLRFACLLTHWLKRSRWGKPHAPFVSLCLLLLASTGLSCTKNKALLPDPLQAGWQNLPVCEILQDDAKLRVLRCTFKPGTGHERHTHKPHFGYTIAGSRMRITDQKGTREVNVTTGSHFYSKGIEWHEVLNIGDSTAIFLIVEPK